jgi:hypothetical protein
MVKAGFIAEGATERTILESEAFRSLLFSIEIEMIRPVIDAGGNGNLLPKHIVAHSTNLINRGTQVIFILTDLDKDICITKTKSRIQQSHKHQIIVSVKEIEAWFLADYQTLSRVIPNCFREEMQEAVIDPFEKIKQEALNSSLQRGFGTKIILAKKCSKMVSQYPMQLNIQIVVVPDISLKN